MWFACLLFIELPSKDIFLLWFEAHFLHVFMKKWSLDLTLDFLVCLAFGKEFWLNSLGENRCMWLKTPKSILGVSLPRKCAFPFYFILFFYLWSLSVQLLVLWLALNLTICLVQVAKYVIFMGEVISKCPWTELQLHSPNNFINTGIFLPSFV